MCVEWKPARHTLQNGARCVLCVRCVVVVPVVLAELVAVPAVSAVVLRGACVGATCAPHSPTRVVFSSSGFILISSIYI
jgi:hypothetical protein